MQKENPSEDRTERKNEYFVEWGKFSLEKTEQNIVSTLIEIRYTHIPWMESQSVEANSRMVERK
jgi:hypothetical protein